MRTRPYHYWNEAEKQFYQWTFVGRDAHHLAFTKEKRPTPTENQHGRRFIVLEHQYDRCDVMWKHSIGLVAEDEFVLANRVSRMPAS